MKPIKHFLAAAAACALAVGLGGCSVSDFSADKLLRPPKAVGDEAEIEDLIASAAQSDYTLKYPKSGSYRSAIITTDLDGDENSEAVAFFGNTSDASTVHMLVMYSTDGSWQTASDNTFETADIDCVDFADINGDGVLEIIVGTATYSSGINNLSCRTYQNGATSTINCSAGCSSFITGDFDGDGTDEIMTFTLYTTENEALAAMLDYNPDNSSIYARAMTNMDPGVTSYKNVSVTKLSDEVSGVAVDAVNASGEMTTQLIYYNKELSLLRNPLYKEKTKNSTQRSTAVICSDINKDGVLEIPVLLELPHESGSSDEYAGKIVWNGFDLKSEKLVEVRTVAANYSDMFMLTMPDKWEDDKATATVNSETGITAFYEWSDGKLGTKLFEIKVSPASEWETSAQSDFILIAKNDEYAYSFRNINTESEVSLTDDEIKTGFSILAQSVI